MTFFWTKTSPKIKLFGINNLYSVRSTSLKVSIFIFKLCVLYAAAAAKLLQLCPTLCDSVGRQPTRPPRPWDSPGKNTGVGYHFLLQCMKVKSEGEVASRVQLFATTWIVAYQAPPSMGFFRQEHWSEFPFPFPVYYINDTFLICGSNADFLFCSRSPLHS